MVSVPKIVVFLAPAVAAVPPVVVELGAERIESPDWRVEDLRAVVELSEQGLRGAVRIGRIEVPGARLDLEDTVVECGEVRLSRDWFRCRDATVDADLPVLGRQGIAGHFDYDRASGTLHLDIPRLAVAGGTAGVSGKTGPAGSDVRFEGESLGIAGLLALAGEPGGAPTELAAGGSANASGTLAIDTAGRVALRLEADLVDASVSNEAGTLVGEAVDGSVRLQAVQDGSSWVLDVELSAGRGETYVEPVYANFAEHPVRLGLREVRTGDFATFDLSGFEFEQGTQAKMSGTARVTLPPGEEPVTIESASVEIADTAVEALYTNLLQIAFAGSALGNLETAGSVSGTVTIADNAPMSASLEFRDVILDDRGRRFAVYGLAGSVNWPGPDGAPADAAPSRLSWDSGNAHGILVNGAEVALDLGGDDLVLREPLRVPTMGGALLVNRLEIHDYGRDEARGLLDAELEPIQLGQLTGAFGWPAFSGSLSGRLPQLTYEGNAMTVGGSLTAQAFDGNVELANLEIAQPFGRVPRLTGDLTLRNLDLERVTNTFSFGLIQGRLSGDVTGLELVAWEPAAMDAHLYSTPGDRTPRRISQRAVENLASVGGGGGAAAVVSTGFLKFFEVFAYEEIGLRCVLADGICRMSGAGPAGEGAFGRGYYIVKGRGLPRIDVIGYRDRVGWDALVRQLSAITRDATPVVN